MPLSLPIEPEATKLLHDSPLALLLGIAQINRSRWRRRSRPRTS